MKSKLKEVFPELLNVSEGTIELFYKDADNDLISVSSDEELRIAEQTVGADETIRLLVDVSEKQQEEDIFDMVDSMFSQVPSGLSHTVSPFSHLSHMFGHLSDPFSPFSGFGSTWSDRKKMLERREESIRRQRVYEEKMREAHLDSIKKMKEKAIKAEDKMATEETGSAEVMRRSSKEFKPVLPVFPPGWHVTPYGAWEPMVYRTPFGTQRVWGPWGYSACYGDEEKDEKKQEKIEEGESKEEMKTEKMEEGDSKEEKMEEIEEKKKEEGESKEEKIEETDEGESKEEKMEDKETTPS